MDKPVNQGLDERLFNYIVNANQAAPYYQMLGIKTRVLSPGYAELVVWADTRHTNPVGRVHGGLVASLADAAMTNAVRSLGYKCVTVEYSVSLMAAPTLDQELVGQGRVVKSGRNLFFVESLVLSADKPVAQAKGVFFNTGLVDI